MHIRKLEMQGFKSFADRASFVFGEGISGVVGPNGCGKSNVVDAVKWCIGEQSAKSLRGDSMSDVIFHGSAGRSAVHFAEVTLTFAAGETPFPGQWQRFAEIEVTRRLYRDGASEYRINQERVRLRDIQDLFMDSGAGNQLYSVIEQGRIGLIVHARPEQRRTLIEEAAGISRYKARRDETQSKLDSTRTSLERVADLADEMARQLRSAERAVQKVVRWRVLQARVRQEDIFVGLVRCSGLMGDRKALSEKVRGLTTTLGEESRTLERLEKELTERRTGLEALEEESGKVRDRLGELEAQRRVEESAAQYQSREREQGTGRLAKLGTDQEEARNERDAATSEAQGAGARRVEADAGLARARASAEDAGRIAQRAGEDERNARSTLERARSTSMTAFQASVRAKGDVQRAAQRRTDLDARAARNREAVEGAGRVGAHVSEEIARIAAQVKEADEAIAHARRAVEAEVAEGQRAVQTARADAARGEAAREAAAKRQREAEAQLTEATRARATIAARVDALDDMVRKNVDVPDGLKPALAVEGVMGVLAGMLDVPEGLDTLLARSLEGGLDTILVPDSDVAQRVALRVKGARARILVVPAQDGTLPAPFDEVRGSEVARRALAALLGDTVIVQGVGDLYGAWAPARRVVARDGAVLRPDGVLVLGTDEGTGTAALKRRRDLAALREQLAAADASVEACRGEVESRKSDVEGAVGEVRRLQAAVDAANQLAARQGEAAREALRGKEAVAAEAKNRLRGQEAERTRQQQAAQQLASEGAQIQRDRAAIDADEVRAQKLVQDAEAEHQRSEEAARMAQGELERVEPLLREATERLQKMRVEAARLQSELAAASETERAAGSRAQRAGARVDLIAKERTELEARLDALALEAVGTSARLQELGEAQGQVRQDLETLKARIVGDRERVKASDEAAKSARTRRDAAKDALGSVETRLAEVRVNLDRVRGDVEEKYELSLPALLDRLDRDGQILLEGHDPPPDSIGGEAVPTLRVTAGDLEGDVAVRAEALKQARDALSRIGEVNLAAEEEYRDVAGRHADIEKQRLDLVEAMDVIEKAIAKINRTCRERFRETFDLVAQHYAEIYPRLTGGGTGRLQLTDEEDLLVAGVEMFAQPPGKKVQNLSLLSGGEKAMAAIGLIFALFRVKPSPFCLLDEVDAPLDEGNGGRFNEMLKEMSRTSQFIVITHNKKTMECADVLYGVTMPEPGTSRLVTVRIDG